MRHRHKDEEQEIHREYYIHVAPRLHVFTKTHTTILVLVLKAAYARDLNFYIVAPNLRINVTTWRPCEASYPSYLAEVSKALRNKGNLNSWLTRPLPTITECRRRIVPQIIKAYAR